MSGRLLEIATEVDLITEECCNCGIVFAMPKEVNKRFRTRGGSFYCPNGHSQHYTEPDIEVLKKKLLVEQQRSQKIETQLDGALVSLNTTKKELLRTKKRVNAGVCPHCRRHFTNVERHIHSKHPEEITQ